MVYHVLFGSEEDEEMPWLNESGFLRKVVRHFGLVALLLFPISQAWADPIPIEFGVEITGEVVDPEIPIIYSFDAAPGTRVYVEQTTDGNGNKLKWTLSDSFERVVSQTGFFEEDLGPVALMGGTYTVTVASNGGELASYSFLTHDVSPTETNISLNEPLTGTVSVPGELHRYRVELSEPANFYMKHISGDNFSLRWGLEDALGNVIVEPTSFMNDYGPFALAAGIHVVTVSGHTNNVGAYEALLEDAPLTSEVQDIDTNSDIVGSVEGAGLAQVYRFELDASYRVFLDLLSTSNKFGMGWSLVDASDNVILPLTSFLSDEGVFVLNPGQYRLTVAGEGSAVGDYSFRVQTSQVTTLEMDLSVPLTGVIDKAGQRNDYTFTLTEPKHFFFDVLSVSNAFGLSWSLTNSLGATLASSTSFLDESSIKLGADSFTFSVRSKADDVGSFEVEFVEVVVEEQSIGLNTSVSGEIDTVGERQIYNFSAPPGQIVTIDQTASSSVFAMEWSLFDDAGHLVIEKSFLSDMGPVALTGGNYRLTILGRSGGDGLGTYTFQVVTGGSSVFVPAGTPTALNTPVTGVLSSSSEVHQFLVEITETSVYYFDVQAGGSGLRWSCFDAVGEGVFTNKSMRFTSSDDIGPEILRPGLYTLEVHSAASSYGFQVIQVLPTQQINVALGDEITGTLSPGEERTYLFETDVSDYLFVDLTSGDFAFEWSLFDPQGQPLFLNRSMGSSSQDEGTLTLMGGTYRLDLINTEVVTESYAFQIAESQINTEPIDIGTDVSKDLSPVGSDQIYTFTLSEASDLFFVVKEGSLFDLTWSLEHESGRVFFRDKNVWDADDSLQLNSLPEGSYSLTMDGVDDETPSYTIGVFQSVNIEIPIELGTDVSSALANPGDLHVYVLDILEAGTPVFFNVIGNEAVGVLWTLEDPLGRVLFEPVSMEDEHFDDQGPFYLMAGEYRLSLQGTVVDETSYHFEVANATQVEAGPVLLNEIITGQITQAGGTITYEVSPSTPGDSLLFDALISQEIGGLGEPDLRWSLIDPVGEAFFKDREVSDWYLHDQGPFPLAGGTYDLIFDPQAGIKPPLVFRVVDGAQPVIPEFPDQCAACAGLDISFVFDTSLSIGSTIIELCDLANSIVSELQTRGIEVQAEFIAIGPFDSIDAFGPCLTTSVTDQYGVDLPGDPPPILGVLGECLDDSAPEVGAQEDWARAVAVTAAQKEWAPNRVRLVVPVVDEEAYCGGPEGDLDFLAVEYAATIAQQHGVIVSPIIPDTGAVSDPTKVQAHNIAAATLGVALVEDFTPLSLQISVGFIADSACSTETDIVTPEVLNLEPDPSTAFAPGTTVTLSGKIKPVNSVRPIAAFLVNGVPVQSTDATGRFFHTVTLEEGANDIQFEMVETCGSYFQSFSYLTVDPDPVEAVQLANVTTQLEVEYLDTTFNEGANRLFVDMVVTNVGDQLVDGPILLAVGPQLHPSISAEPVADTGSNGEPLILVLPEGVILAPGESSPPVLLSLNNPDRRKVFFEESWVAPGNQAPLFTSVPPTQVKAGQLYSYEPAAVDPNGHLLSFSLVLAPEGMTIDSGTGLINWSTSLDDEGGHEVGLVVSDGRGGSALQRYTITATSPLLNAPPVFVSTPLTSVPVGAAYSYGALAVDSDGDVVEYALLNAPVGMAVDSGSGLIQWSSAESGIYSITLEASDEGDASTTQSWILAVGAIADNVSAPVISSVPPVQVVVKQPYVYQVIAQDPDGDSIEYSLTQSPTGMVIDPALGRVTWTPANEDEGAHLITLKASDGLLGETFQTYTLVVQAELPNNAPFFVSTPLLDAVSGLLYSYNSQAQDPDLDPLSYQLATGPEGMELDAETGLLTWTPEEGFLGQVVVSMKARDDEDAVGNQVFQIDVRATNEAPTIGSAPELSALVGKTYLYDVHAIDGDGDVLTYSLVSAPAAMTIKGGSGLIEWKPGVVDEGSAAVTVRAADCCGGVADQSYDITVINDVVAPTVIIDVIPDSPCLQFQAKACVKASDDVGVVSRTFRLEGIFETGTLNLLLDEEGCTLLPQFVSEDLSAPLPMFATASDASGNQGEATGGLVLQDCLDEEDPVVEIISPPAGSQVTGLVDLQYTITDNSPEFLTWELSYAPFGQEELIPLAEGEGEVTAEVLGTLDTTLLPSGDYKIHILASDGFQTSGFEYFLSVVGHLKLGNFRLDFNDMQVRLAGIPLGVSRSYNTLETTGKDFGIGWRLGLSAEVSDFPDEIPEDAGLAETLAAPTFLDGTRVVVTKPNGTRAGFSFVPKSAGFPGLTSKPAFQPDPGVRDTLEVVEDVTLFNIGGKWLEYILPYNPDLYVLTTEDEVKFIISEKDGLLSIENADGVVINVTPDGLFAENGDSLTYERDELGRITRITGPDTGVGSPETVEYAYDDAGNLASFTDISSEATAFEYTNANFPNYLTAVIDPTGQPLARLVFDDETGRITASCDANGDVATLEGCDIYEFDAEGGSSTFFDADGNKIERFFDARGNMIVERQFPDASQFLEFTFEFDELDNIIRFADAGGQVWEYGYDFLGNPISQTDPTGGISTWEANEVCNTVANNCDPLGNCRYFDYDEACNLTTIQDSLGNIYQYTYSEDAAVLSYVDPNGSTWSLDYDETGNWVGLTDPQGHSETRIYDAKGRQTSFTDRNGRTFSYAYNEKNLVVSEVVDTVPPTVTTWSYDVLDRIVTVANNNAIIDLEYWPDGKVKSITTSGLDALPPITITYGHQVGDTLVQGHNGRGLITHVSDSFGGLTEYVYDGASRNVEIRQSGDGVIAKRVTTQYDVSNSVVGREVFSNLEATEPLLRAEIEHACPGCGLLPISMRWTRTADDVTLHEVLLTRNELGMVTGILDSDGQHNFSYDGLLRLIEAEHVDATESSSEAYVYDGFGNRTSSNLSPDLLYGYMDETGGSELLDDGTYTYSYDGVGNLTERVSIATGERDIFAYDFRNRMIQRQQLAADNTVLSNTEMTFGLSDALLKSNHNGEIRYYVYDGENPILVLNEDGTVRTRRLYRRIVDVIVADEHLGQGRWFLTDHLGSVRDLVDFDGNVIAHYEYDSFGALISGPEDVENTLRFTAREFIGDGDLGHYRKREYDPSTGRFLQIDTEAMGNYIYAQNAPLTFTDPTGRIVAAEYATLICEVSIPAASFGVAIGKVAGAYLAIASDVVERANKRLPPKTSYTAPFPPIPGYPPSKKIAICGITLLQIKPLHIKPVVKFGPNGTQIVGKLGGGIKTPFGP